MLARKPTSLEAQALSQEWSAAMADLLNGTYAKECQKEGRVFEVYGQAFPEELLVIVSLTGDKAMAPVTCFLSADVKSAADSKKHQQTLIEVAGQFFEEIFGNASWDEWEPNWQEVEYQKYTYWYKLSRESIGLTLEADRLLQAAGFDPDDTD